MKQIYLIIAFIGIFQWSALNGFSQNEVSNGKKLRSVGYIPVWKYDCYNTVDYSALTHLNIAFCNPDKAGNMQNPFRGNAPVFHDIVKKAHENGVKVIASLGGGGGGKNYPDLIATDGSRAAFCEKIMQFVDEYNLDGVDLDLEENPDHILWANYEAWTKELRRRCTDKNKLLTAAVSTWFSDSMTDETFACFDYITLMAYDGPFDNHSSYEAGEAMIRHYLNVRRVNADKIVLGIPFYGHQGGKYNAIGFKDIIAANPQAHDSDYVDSTSYNGISTVKRKCELAKQYGGIMIWELSDDIEGEYSLLKAVKESLYGEETTIKPE